MWIKICGITSLKDAELAVTAGTDAVGFVFAESPRRVTPETVRQIIRELPPSVEKIGVFVDAALDEIAAVHRRAGLTGVQLQGGNGDLVAQGLRRQRKGDSDPLRVLRVVRYDGDLRRFAAQLHAAGANMDDRKQDAVLVDTCIAGKTGGTGIPFDWQAAQDSFLRQAPSLRMIAAGGLNPENVGEAIHTLRPWGVDVSSGVEIAPGRKDPKRIAAFIRAARAAEMELDPENATVPR